MNEIFEIKTARQLRLFNASETRAVFEAMLDEQEGISAREVGERVGMSAESAHYHLGKLEKLGLVGDVGSRESGARPERLFGLRYRSVVLKRGKRGPAYIREIIRGVRLMLRKAEREYEQAWAGSNQDCFRPRAVRSVAWLCEQDLAELKDLEDRLNMLFQRADKAHRSGASAKRQRMAITITLSSIE